MRKGQDERFVAGGFGDVTPCCFNVDALKRAYEGFGDADEAFTPLFSRTSPFLFPD